jgi:hypothetical protein
MVLSRYQQYLCRVKKKVTHVYAEKLLGIEEKNT